MAKPNTTLPSYLAAGTPNKADAKPVLPEAIAAKAVEELVETPVEREHTLSRPEAVVAYLAANKGKTITQKVIVHAMQMAVRQAHLDAMAEHDMGEHRRALPSDFS